MPLNEQTDSSGKHESTTEDTRYDSDPYYKTKTYEHIEKLLKDSAVSILIVGHPGSGKSFLVKMLNDKFRRKKVVEDGYHDSMYMKCLEDVETHKPDENTRMIYIVEDCFEEWNQYPHLASQGIEKLIDLHKKVIDKGHCLVVTLSKWNYEYYLDSAGKAHLKQCKKLEVIDLSTNVFQLDITDKNGILEYHRKKKGSTAQRMDEKEVRKVTDPGFFQGYFSNVLKLNLELEFPLSCRLFYSHDSFVAQKKDFFNDAKQKIWEFVRGLARGSSEEKNQYCTLIYAALCGGKIHSKNKNLFFLKDIANVAKIDLQYPQFDFECSLIIQGTDINSHEIVHEEITKLLFKEFGIAHMIFVINKCDTGILLKYVRTDDRVRTSYHIRNGLLILRNDMYEHLAKRLMNLDTEKRKHIIFKDRKFDMKCRTAWNVPQESETEF